MARRKFNWNEIGETLDANLTKRGLNIPVPVEVVNWLQTLNFKELHAVYMGLKAIKHGTRF